MASGDDRERAGSDDAFARAFAREIIASEILRAKVLAVVLSVLLAVVRTTFFIGHDAIQKFVTRPISWWVQITVTGPFILYECFVVFILSRFAARGTHPPWIARYANAAIEVSLPSVIMLVASTYVTPDLVFAAWPSLLYFVFILASTLRLNFALPALTGAVAAVEYMAVAAYILPPSPSADQALLTPLFHEGRALIMLMAGVVAGLVAMRLRGNLLRVLEASAARERVVNLFGQHVSPSVVDRLLSSTVETEAEARQVCVMFLDIRNFTAFTRQQTPAEVVGYLNRAFGFMVEAVDRHHGIVNKFLGDGFMAIFGAPLSDPRAAEHALAAAREILAEIDRRAAAGEAVPRVGIGLHLGMAMTGNVGSARRKEYTVIGDAVNLAARIEQLNKELGSRLLVSGAVAEALGATPGSAERLAATVKGYAAPITVWRLD
ncbi:MAG: adenylate/guanylate cyclase domain-containing protein [Alphaproteobacteria bacterium]|nr:adenylate/guanylate cyclase domain-containing protein [Alphaproteobacteria bacterium]